MIVKPLYSIKKIITLLGVNLLFLTTSVFAQNSTSSPYSYYGLGAFWSIIVKAPPSAPQDGVGFASRHMWVRISA